MVIAARSMPPLTSALLFWTVLACTAGGCQRFGSLLPNRGFSRQPPISQVAPWRPSSPATPKLSKKEQAEGKFALARSVEKSSELEQAANAYEDVIKSEEKHPAAHHRLAVVC